MDPESSEVRFALSAINYNATNYKVLDVFIILSIIFSIATIAGSLVAFQASDQDPSLSPQATKGFIIVDFVALGLILVAYISYLRNVGNYIYGRIKPFDINKPPCPT
jgi:hypothetical protein